MERQVILETFVEVASAVFGREVACDENLRADDVPEWDSLENFRLLVSLEKRFNIKFTGSEITDLKNVGTLVTLIQSKL